MKLKIVAVVVTGLLAANVAHAAESITRMVINSTFMARLPLYVILLMISVTMVIKLMPVSALRRNANQ
ncbi:outer membrane porin [Escherichia coli]|uniref:Outer membrane porin n=1 Tax=Escherichia coli TaxID=562 RepID=A0A377A0X4_ECOLX|nr:outer membrane porin [Escherichia coli]